MAKVQQLPKVQRLELAKFKGPPIEEVKKIPLEEIRTYFDERPIDNTLKKIREENTSDPKNDSDLNDLDFELEADSPIQFELE